MKIFIDRVFAMKLLKKAWQKLFTKSRPSDWDNPFIIY